MHSVKDVALAYMLYRQYSLSSLILTMDFSVAVREIVDELISGWLPMSGAERPVGLIDIRLLIQLGHFQRNTACSLPHTYISKKETNKYHGLSLHISNIVFSLNS